MRRVSATPRVQIIRESTEVDRPKYGGLFKKEMACQTSETKVKEFQTVLKQLDTIKTDLSQTSTVIRMDCEVKLKSKADELKKEYQKKVVDLQRSYTQELDAIKHKLVKKYVPQGETIYFGSILPNEEHNTDSNGSLLGGLYSSKGSNETSIHHSPDTAAKPTESNHLVFQSEIVKLRAENRLLVAKLKAAAKSSYSGNSPTASNNSLNEGGWSQKQPGNLLTISESQGNGGSKAGSRRTSIVSVTDSNVHLNNSNHSESSNSHLNDQNGLAKDAILIQKLLKEVQSRDEEIKRLQRENAGVRSSIAGFGNDDQYHTGRPPGNARQRPSVASISLITDTIGSEFKNDLNRFSSNLDGNLEKLGKRISDASEISGLDHEPMKFKNNSGVEDSQNLSDADSSRDQLEPSFEGPNVVDFGGFNFTQVVGLNSNPPPPKPGSLVRRSSLLENSRRLSSAIQADIDAINGVKSPVRTSISNPSARTSIAPSARSSMTNNPGRAIESDHPIGSIQRRSSLVGVSLLSAINTQNLADIGQATSSPQQQQSPSLVRRQSVDNGRNSIAQSPTGHGANAVNFSLPSSSRRSSIDATGNEPSPKLQRRPTMDQGIKRRQSMSVAAAKGISNYDIQSMIQERAQELISEQVKTFAVIKNRYVNKIEDLRELIGRYDNKLQESRAIKQEMKEMLQHKDQIISDLEKKLEVAMAEYQRRLKRIKVNCTDSVQKVSTNLKKEINIYRTRFEMMREGLKKCSHTDPAFRDIMERQSELVKLINIGALNGLVDSQVSGDGGEDGNVGTGDSNFGVYDETGAEFQDEEEVTPSSEISTSRSEEEISTDSLNNQ